MSPAGSSDHDNDDCTGQDTDHHDQQTHHAAVAGLLGLNVPQHYRKFCGMLGHLMMRWSDSILNILGARQWSRAGMNHCQLKFDIFELDSHEARVVDNED